MKKSERSSLKVVTISLDNCKYTLERMIKTAQISMMMKDRDIVSSLCVSSEEKTLVMVLVYQPFVEMDKSDLAHNNASLLDFKQELELRHLSKRLIIEKTKVTVLEKTMAVQNQTCKEFKLLAKTSHVN